MACKQKRLGYKPASETRNEGKEERHSAIVHEQVPMSFYPFLDAQIVAKIKKTSQPRVSL